MSQIEKALRCENVVAISLWNSSTSEPVWIREQEITNVVIGGINFQERTSRNLLCMLCILKVKHPHLRRKKPIVTALRFAFRQLVKNII